MTNAAGRFCGRVLGDRGAVEAGARAVSRMQSPSLAVLLVPDDGRWILTS